MKDNLRNHRLEETTPEADALEQNFPVTEGEDTEGSLAPRDLETLDSEQLAAADEADVLDQHREVPPDEDDAFSHPTD